MAKKDAPAALTGGSGFLFEDYVAARLLLDALGGISTFDLDFGSVVRLDWQAKDAGRLLDDLVVTLRDVHGTHTAELSVKSHRQVTESGFPENFVEAAWEQWLGTVSKAFQKQSDLLVLVTGKIANSVVEAWEKTLREALATTPERMVARLSPPANEESGSLSSQVQRDLFSSFHCPATLRDHGDTGDTATLELLRRIRLLHFDFQSEPSRDKGRAVADCQSLLRSGNGEQARQLWDALLGIAAEHRTSGGSVDLSRLLGLLRDRFDLHDHPNYRADWESLDRTTREILDDIQTKVGGTASLERDADLQAVGAALTDKGLCIAVGESGCGKSGIAKMLGQQRYGRVVALPIAACDVGQMQQLEESIGLCHSLVDVLQSSREGCLVVLDAVERCSESGLRMMGRLIREMADDDRLRHVHVLLTAHFESSRRVIEQLAKAGVDRSWLKPLPIDCPDESAIRDLLASVTTLSWVASAFARSVIQPGYDQLLSLGLQWLHRAADKSRDGQFWQESNLESNLVEVLRACWERHKREIGVDHELRDSFTRLMTILAARGSNSAIALRDQVVDSIPSGS